MKRREVMNDEAVRGAVRAMLQALGFDVTDQAIVDTPARVARAWKEQLAGYWLKAEDVLKTQFDAAEYDEVVALRSIPFFSTCEHHLLPFYGKADVAYLPAGGKVVGLSKLARLVDMHARRLQLQERMTASIADDLERVLAPAGVAVVVEAQHLCMCARGVGKPGAAMVTSVMRGCFRNTPEARAEVMALIRSDRGQR
jgi:GTP cyclohydrolase I